MGASRTGSTLLRHMLAAHPGVGVLNESHWVPRMVEEFGCGPAPLNALVSIVDRTNWDTGRRVVDVNLDLAGSSWDRLVQGLRSRLGERSSVSDFHDALVDIIFGDRGGTSVRGDKTPDYGFYMKALQEVWPKSRFVHVVRNGVDTARSMARHPGIQLMISAGYDNWVPLACDHAYERHERRELPFSAFVASWRRRMTRIRQEGERLSPGSYLEVRYEDLRKDPCSVLRTVADHLALPSSESWLPQAAGLVEPRANSNPITSECLRGLSLEDLQALAQVGRAGSPFLPWSSSRETLDLAMRGARERLDLPGTAAEATPILVGVLATEASQSDPGLRLEVLTLLRDSVLRSGESPGDWTVLDELRARS